MFQSWFLGASHMYNFYKDIACSDRLIIAQKTKTVNKPTNYKLQQIKRPGIPNKALALSIYYSGSPVSAQQIQEDVKQYNDYVSFLNEVPGFITVFTENGLTISKNQALTIWPEEVVKKIFSLNQYYFETPLHVEQDILYDCNFIQAYNVTIADEAIVLPIGKTSSAYPTKILGKTCIWNWINDGHDFTYSLWRLLGERFCQDEETDDEDSDENRVTYGIFEDYESCRGNLYIIQFIKIFVKLEKLGYLETYTIKPEAYDVRWCQYGKSDCSIDLALIDENFKKNKLLMEQIELLMWSKPETLEKPYYFLTDKDNKQFLSDKPAQFGGHRKLKIYGRLDCPSANRYVQQGEYVKHRVFFQDEATAIAAGYRPCGKCMPEAYKKWKADKKK